MNRIVVSLIVGLFLFSVPAARAHVPEVWSVKSPDHEQTFAYGTETRRAWSSRGNHLVLLLNYTNDPFVDWTFPRENDSFSFDFPNVRLQPDGHTFSYSARDGHAVPVAVRRPGFLGIDEIRLLPTSELLVDLPHGYITVTLQIVE